MTIVAENSSITESRPKPTGAIEAAISPAMSRGKGHCHCLSDPTSLAALTSSFGSSAYPVP